MNARLLLLMIALSVLCSLAVVMLSRQLPAKPSDLALRVDAKVKEIDITLRGNSDRLSSIEAKIDSLMRSRR